MASELCMALGGDVAPRSGRAGPAAELIGKTLGGQSLLQEPQMDGGRHTGKAPITQGMSRAGRPQGLSPEAPQPGGEEAPLHRLPTPTWMLALLSWKG